MTLPHNNAGVLADPDTAKDRFFLLAEVKRTDRETEINIRPDGPIVAIREEDQATLNGGTGDDVFELKKATPSVQTAPTLGL